MKLLPCLLNLLVHRHTQPRPRPDIEHRVYLLTGHFNDDGNLYMEGDITGYKCPTPGNKGERRTPFLDFLETF